MLREAKALARMRHPDVVGISDVFEDVCYALLVPGTQS